MMAEKKQQFVLVALGEEGIRIEPAVKALNIKDAVHLRADSSIESVFSKDNDAIVSLIEEENIVILYGDRWKVLTSGAINLIAGEEMLSDDEILTAIRELAKANTQECMSLEVGSLIDCIKYDTYEAFTPDRILYKQGDADEVIEYIRDIPPHSCSKLIMLMDGKFNFLQTNSLVSGMQTVFGNDSNLYIFVNNIDGSSDNPASVVLIEELGDEPVTD